MSLKKFCLIGVIGLWSMASCTIQKHATTEQREHVSSLLWKISGKNLPAPSYLFGTIHLICPDKFFWTTAMQEAFDTCKQLAEEVNLRDTAEIMQIQKGTLLPQGKKLQDYFTKEEFDEIIAFAKDSIGMAAAAMVLPLIKPNIALMLLSLKTGIKCKGETVSYDVRLADWAVASGKKIKGLETAHEQMDAINSVDPDSSIQRILRLVRHPDNSVKEYEDLLQAYLHQDLHSLNKFMISSMAASDLNVMLYERNKKWIGRIEKLIHQQSTFIAVGAGHLGGAKGVISLLKKEGYMAEPIR